MTLLIVAVGVLGAAVIALAVLLTVTVNRLGRARRRAQQLERALRGPARPPRRTTATRVVQAVVDGAARIREQGLGGLVSQSLDDLVQWARDDRAQILRFAGRDGRVTILFSDIEGSTELNDRLGDRDWLPVLEAHSRVVRGAVERHRGHVVKELGDGVMAVFPDPTSAVRAAADVHDGLARSDDRRLRRQPVAVRVGVHTGTALARDGDYLGRDVAIAARVAAQARGGQTLVSDVVAAQVEGTPGWDVVDLGPAALKGIAEPVTISTVVPREQPTSGG